MVKLARPNVFHPRIVLASCPQLVDGDGDDDGLISALRKRGLHARWLSWDDPATEDADLVILRAAWDYAERLEEFWPGPNAYGTFSMRRRWWPGTVTSATCGTCRRPVCQSCRRSFSTRRTA